MPFPRFEKLDAEKRTRLMETAAREFATHGFNDASINRILDQARISKGAAYYYFADKADLFATTVRYCSDRLHLIDEGLDAATLTATSFWPTFARLHREPLIASYEHPWLFGALKAAGSVAPATLQTGPLAQYVTQFVTYVMDVVHQGQLLHVIRDDLPDELLFAWLQALDRASDDWLLAHWHELTPATLTRLSDQTVAAMQRAVAPEQ